MFIELELPTRAYSSPKFYVSNNDCNYFLRNDGKGVDDSSDDYDLYLFVAVGDAHYAAMAYYVDYNKPYPYHAEYYDALQKHAADSTINESQIMKFT